MPYCENALVLEWESDMGASKKTGFIRFVRWYTADWYVETIAMDPVTLCAYMRLAAHSRNSADNPGKLVATLSVLAAAAGITVEQVWVALCRMTVCSRSGQPLIQLEWSEDEKNRLHVTVSNVREMEKKRPDGYNEVIVTFAWIQSEEREQHEYRRKECERVQAYKQERMIAENANKTGKNEGCKTDVTKNYKALRVTDKKLPAVTPDYGHKDKDKDKDKSIPPTPLKGGSVFETWFETVFWKAYPRKVSKPAAMKAARKAWKAVDADEIMRTLAAAVEQDSRFRDPQYVPYPASWLNSEPWGNEEGAGVGAGERVAVGSGSGQFGEVNGKRSAVSGERAAATKNPECTRLGALLDV
jgi:hypothetical protein